jgi:hypothetical protein
MLAQPSQRQPEIVEMKPTHAVAGINLELDEQALELVRL